MTRVLQKTLLCLSSWPAKKKKNKMLSILKIQCNNSRRRTEDELKMLGKNKRQPLSATSTHFLALSSFLEAEAAEAVAAGTSITFGCRSEPRKRGTDSCKCTMQHLKYRHSNYLNKLGLISIYSPSPSLSKTFAKIVWLRNNWQHVSRQAKQSCLLDLNLCLHSWRAHFSTGTSDYSWLTSYARRWSANEY